MKARIWIVGLAVLISACSKRTIQGANETIGDSNAIPSQVVEVCGDKILMGAGMAFRMDGAAATYLPDGIYGTASCNYHIVNGKVIP